MPFVAIFFALAASSGSASAEGCLVDGGNMVCPNGVAISGVGQSVIFGDKSLAEGTGERRAPDGLEVHDFGNSGIDIGGQGEAVRAR